MLEHEEIVVKYEKYLRKKEKAESTIKTYIWTVNDFYKKYNILNKGNLLMYKDSLIKKNKPRTVFLRITAINNYLAFVKKKELTLLNVKLPKMMYLDNVISNKDYAYLKKCLKKDGYIRDYYLVWLICATGSRISEALQFTVRNIQDGYMDIYGKGVKHRRIYIPSKLKKELLNWLDREGIKDGTVFRNKNGVTIAIRGVESNFRRYAKRYSLNPKDCHPHSFRHRFALNFIENYKVVNNISQVGAISDLADILGHSSIAVTQIYLHRTASEQRDMLEKIVTW